VTLGPFFLCGIAFLNTPVVNCWIVELLGVFDQPCAQLLVCKNWICTAVFHSKQGGMQQYRPYIWGSSKKILVKLNQSWICGALYQYLCGIQVSVHFLLNMNIAVVTVCKCWG
jgi:hypothetical protein